VCIVLALLTCEYNDTRFRKLNFPAALLYSQLYYFIHTQYKAVIYEVIVLLNHAKVISTMCNSFRLNQSTTATRFSWMYANA
jgi:hypothetical protein